MGFGSNSKLSSAVSGSSGGGYLSPSKIQSGGSARFHILSEEPLEYFCVWGESPDGQVKPFRFEEDPSTADVEEAMGDTHVRRMNREGTGPEAIKPEMSFVVWEYEAQTAKICTFSQKGLIRELLSIASMEDYQNLEDFDFTLGKEGSGLTTEYSLRAVPVKKDLDRKAALKEASKIKLEALLTGDNPFQS
jgi:hypothetical protein